MLELESPTTLAEGRYRLDRVLGHGGMASVWLGWDVALERPIAIKLLSDALAHDSAYLARFEREAKVAAGLSHPNLVQIAAQRFARRRPGRDRPGSGRSGSQQRARRLAPLALRARYARRLPCNPIPITNSHREWTDERGPVNSSSDAERHAKSVCYVPILGCTLKQRPRPLRSGYDIQNLRISEDQDLFDEFVEERGRADC